MSHSLQIYKRYMHIHWYSYMIFIYVILKNWVKKETTQNPWQQYKSKRWNWLPQNGSMCLYTITLEWTHVYISLPTLIRMTSIYLTWIKRDVKYQLPGPVITVRNEMPMCYNKHLTVFNLEWLKGPLDLRLLFAFNYLSKKDYYHPCFSITLFQTSLVIIIWLWRVILPHLQSRLQTFLPEKMDVSWE